MQSKFSTFVLASAALAAVALATLPAVAETSTDLTVPFSFTVAGQSMPAGQYSVQRDQAGSLVRLASKDASHRFTWLAAPTAAKGDKVILKFDPSGQTHVLESVQYGSLVTGSLNKKSTKAEDVSPKYAPGE